MKNDNSTQNTILKNSWKIIKRVCVSTVMLVTLGVLCVCLFLLVAVANFSFTNSRRKNTNVHHPKVTRVAKTKHAQGHTVHGDIYTKHFYSGTDGGENEMSPKLEAEAKKKATDGAKRYINGTANRSQYLTYIAPAKLVTLNANTGWGDYIKVAQTTAVFVKRANYTKKPAFN